MYKITIDSSAAVTEELADHLLAREWPCELKLSALDDVNDAVVFRAVDGRYKRGIAIERATLATMTPAEVAGNISFDIERWQRKIASLKTEAVGAD